MNLESLLSDEFVEFSKKVEDIHNRKKSLKAEFQQVQIEFQKNLTTLNHEAQVTQAEFEAWQESKVKGAESFDVIKARKLEELEKAGHEKAHRS